MVRAQEILKMVVVIVFAYLCVGICLVESGGHGHYREHYQCEKYCRTDCKLISDKEHRHECDKVHSSESGCHCRVHNTELGIFIIAGLTLVLLLTCCACRHCRKKQGTTTRIVVVAQPETVTTISQPGFQNQVYSHQGYSITVSPQTHPRHYKQREADASAVTVTTQPWNTSSMPMSPLPSDRVFFEEDPARRSGSDDTTFAPPSYH